MRHPFRPTRDSAARAILGCAMFIAYMSGFGALVGLAFIGMGG